MIDVIDVTFKLPVDTEVLALIVLTFTISLVSKFIFELILTVPEPLSVISAVWIEVQLSNWKAPQSKLEVKGFATPPPPALASTYAFVAASCADVGSTRFRIFLLLMLILLSQKIVPDDRLAIELTPIAFTSIMFLLFILKLAPLYVIPEATCAVTPGPVGTFVINNSCPEFAIGGPE